MLHCPLCRALLNGAETCRRCRADLRQVLELERHAGQLAGAAMHALAFGETTVASRLLRRAKLLHATPELASLAQMVARQIASTSEAQRAVDHRAVDDCAGDISST